jgi:putative transposase
VCLRFVFLVLARVLAAARLSRRDTAWRTAEILLLQHQLAVLQRQLGQRARPKVSWADRALMALLLGLIPRGRHPRMRLIVTPGTILRWRRDLLRRSWARKSKPKGRPPTRRNIRALVLRMARESDTWGYRRIAGELAGLGITVAPCTVWEILKKHGIDPAPRRSGPSWSQFLRSQAEAIIACDFFTVGLLDGTKTHVLAVIEHGGRHCSRGRRARSVRASYGPRQHRLALALPEEQRESFIDPGLWQSREQIFPVDLQNPRSIREGKPFVNRQVIVHDPHMV